MYIVALDIGTGGLHVAVYQKSGHLLADTYKVFTYSSDSFPRSLVFSPEELFADAMDQINIALARAAVSEDGEFIFCITGQRHGSVFLDERMTPVLAVANLDGRVDEETAQVFQNESSRIYEVCGRLPSEIFPAMRLYWMERHQKELYNRIRGFLMINEWFAYRLCGTPYAEKTSVSESLLFDVSREMWSDEMALLFGQDHLERWPVVDPGTIVGTVSNEVVAEYRLSHRSLVSLGAGDTQCAAVGSRAFESGDIVIVNGSTTPVVMVTEALTPDPARTTWANLYDGKRFLIESNAGRTGMVYRDVMRMLACQDLPEADIRAVFDAERFGVSAVLVPDPYRSVDFLGYRSGVLFNGDPVPMMHLLPYLVLENTAFAIAAHVDKLRQVSGTEVRKVFLTGGSSRSPLTQTIVSVLLERFPLYLTSTYDTTAKGASMMALAERDDRIPLDEVFSEADSMHAAKPLEIDLKRALADLIRARYDWWKKSIQGKHGVGA